ncbi:HigA family addiction module antitoxin [bacterium]|nr:HigA family addiction module antitoxin [bacterium]
MSIHLKSLIFSPETAPRNRLKQALMQTRLRTTSFFARDSREALRFVGREKDLAVIFIRSSLSPKAINAFQTEVAQAELTYKPIFALLLDADHNVSEHVSRYYVGGMEGFLQEPFATDTVDELLDIAFQNRKRQVDEEEKRLNALRFMIRDGLQLVDEAALQRYLNERRGGGFALRRMKRLRLRTRKAGDDLVPEILLRLLEEEVVLQGENLELERFVPRETKVAFAEHPGKILSTILSDRNLSSERLATLLDVEQSYLEELLAEQAGITPQVSKGLARILGNTEDYWLSLQKAYELYISRQ